MSQGVRVVLTVAGMVGLLLLAWVVSGFLIGGTSGQQASTTPERTSTDSGEVENLQNSAQEDELPDEESYSAYQSKDPFRQLLAPAQESANGEEANGGGEDGGAAGGDGDQNGQSAGGSGVGGSQTPTDGASPGGDAGQPSGGGTGQPSPGREAAGDSRDPSPLPEGDSPESETTSPRDQRGAGGTTEGRDGLFNSGGGLPPPR